MDIDVEKLLNLKELSDKEKEIPTELLKEFEIDDTLEQIEIRKEIVKLFESNKELLKQDLKDLTIQLMNLMQNFKSSSNKFISGGYKNAGRSARLNLNGLVNLKTEWNRKSMLLGV